MACICDAGADDFPAPYNSETDRDAQPMPAARAAAEMEMPPGFSVTVFASEPEVQNPIGYAWDSRGRLWVAENYTYAERSQRFDLGLRDRVIVLADTDGDGVSDSRTVFTDAVSMLTSVEVGHGGVWLMCPPRLLFIPDADRDCVPDGPARVVLDGFEVAKENYHNFANGLRWGPDGWLYGRCGGSCPGRIGPPGAEPQERAALEGGLWRYDPRTGQVDVLVHGTTNPWGHDWNSVGEGFFVNTVNGHLWHLIPGSHYARPFTLDPNPRVYEPLDMHADHWHFDTGKSWTESRSGAANDHGGGHAHSGATIYLGDQWPAKYRDHLLTLNLHGRRINHEVLARRGSGYVAHHGPDLAISGDPFFRGIDLGYGPDGSVYVLDWSDTGECHETTGVHRTSGRIYRIAYQGPGAGEPSGPAAPFDLAAMTSAQLVALQETGSEWFARQARLILAERAGPVRAGEASGDAAELAAKGLPEATLALEAMARGEDARVAYRALVTLRAMGAAEESLLMEMTHHRSETARAWAVRLLGDRWPIDDCYGPRGQVPGRGTAIAAEMQRAMPRMEQMAVGDPSALVRRVLASMLQRLPADQRIRLARALVMHRVDASDHNLPYLVWFGLMPVADHDLEGLALLALQCQWPKTQRWIARCVAENSHEHPRALETLLGGMLEERDVEVRRNLLSGVADGLRGWRSAPRPAAWDAVVRQMETSGDEVLGRIARELSVVFGDGRAVAEVRRIVLDETADIGLRRSALRSLIASGSEGVRAVCIHVLGDPRLNPEAAEGLAGFDDPAVARELVAAYRRFRAPNRPRVIEILASRATFADELLSAVERGVIPREDLSAYHVRQLYSLGREDLVARVRRVWGEIRTSPEEKAAEIARLREALTADRLRAADLSQGRRLFAKTCAGCHRLYGEGDAIGPDLTGSNRNNLDYLLENIVDPAAVVAKDFRMTTVLLDDGRVVQGLVTAQSDRTLTIRTQTDSRTFERDQVEAMRTTSASPMPDGLLAPLSEDEILDLVAYLMHPVQVPIDSARDAHGEDDAG